MRLFAVFLISGFGWFSPAWSEARPTIGTQMFCEYVAEFAPQIARNRIRQVPFLRLDEFNYFDDARSQFLRQTAREIYSQPLGTLRQSLQDLDDIYETECRDAFGQN